MNEPSFWPSHVAIGEFFEKPKKTKMGDYLDFPSLKSKEPTDANTGTIEIEENHTPAMSPNGSSRGSNQ